MSIVSSLDGYSGAGIDKLVLKIIPQNVHGQITQITLNNGKERVNKCHLKKDIHDYVTWATNLTQMMLTTGKVKKLDSHHLPVMTFIGRSSWSKKFQLYFKNCNFYEYVKFGTIS